MQLVSSLARLVQNLAVWFCASLPSRWSVTLAASLHDCLCSQGCRRWLMFPSLGNCKGFLTTAVRGEAKGGVPSSAQMIGSTS